MRSFAHDSPASRRRARRRRDGDDAPLVPGLLLDRGGARPPGNLVTAQRKQVLAAQRVAGNQWVSQQLSPESFRMRAVISRDGRRDAHQETIVEESGGKATLSLTDSVGPSLGYSSSISRGNPKLGDEDFGLTTWSAEVVDPVVKANAAARSFEVSAGIDCPVRWEVHGLGMKDVSSADSPNLTSTNWARAADDLTPDVSDQNGRPPRYRFWARDLTERHELYHAHDAQKYSQRAFAEAEGWLAKQSAATEAEALARLKKIPDRMSATLQATYIPRSEHRAYGEGAPDYLTRALDIRANGKANRYPRGT